MKIKKSAKAVLFLIITVLLLVTFALTLTFYERNTYPRKYRKEVEKYSEMYSVPDTVVYSVIKVESNFNKDAVSSAGASGLMQLMPTTYEWLCEKVKTESGDIFDPDENIRFGTYYLSILYEKYEDWDKVFCAYNAGTKNTDEWMSDGDFNIEFSETENYVYKIKTTVEKYSKLYDEESIYGKREDK